LSLTNVRKEGGGEFEERGNQTKPKGGVDAGAMQTPEGHKKKSASKRGGSRAGSPVSTVEGAEKTLKECPLGIEKRKKGVARVKKETLYPRGEPMGILHRRG